MQVIAATSPLKSALGQSGLTLQPHMSRMLATAYNVKGSHYELLSQHLRKCSNHEINIVLGDFNARLSEQLPEETHVIGKHIYRTSTSTLEDLSEQQRQNRQLFVDFCLTHKLIPMNTWFEKPTPKLATYRSTTTTHFDLSGVNTATHAQLDYILINDTWRNSIKNIYNIHETLLDFRPCLSCSRHARQICI